MKLDEAMMLFDTHLKVGRATLWVPTLADDLADAIVEDMRERVSGGCVIATTSITRTTGTNTTRWMVEARIECTEEPYSQAAFGAGGSKIDAAFACVNAWDERRQMMMEKKDEP